MIGLLTVSHKRPKIDKAYCLMTDRIMKDYPGVFLPVCVVSLAQEAELFREHGIETYVYKNDPVSDKHNYIFKKLRGRVSGVLYLGSDDIIDNRYIDELLSNRDKDIVWGVGIYFYQADTGIARFWDAPYRHAAGPAKLISERLLDKCDWTIWKDGLNNRLDHDSYQIMEPFIESRHVFKVRDTGAVMIDIKSDFNINSFKTFAQMGIQIDAEFLYNKIGSSEADYLKLLINT